MALAGVVGIPLALWALVRVRRRAPAVFFLGAFAALAVLPSANLLRLIGSIMAERFLYLPLAGFAGMVAPPSTWAASPGRRAAARVVGAVVLALAARTAARNLDWRDERTLWAATVRAAPDSAKAQKGYASALVGSQADAATLVDAIAHAERAVAIRPDYQQSLVDLGGYEIRLGDTFTGQPDVAQRWYEKALTALESARALDEKSTARFVEQMRARGNPDDTIPDVGDGILFNNLAIAYVKLARRRRARRARMRAPADERRALPRHRRARCSVGQTDDAAVALSRRSRSTTAMPGEAAPGGAVPELSRRRPDRDDRAAGRHADPHGDPIVRAIDAALAELVGISSTPPPIGGGGTVGSGELWGIEWVLTVPAFQAGAMALSHSADGRDREGRGVSCARRRRQPRQRREPLDVRPAPRARGRDRARRAGSDRGRAALRARPGAPRHRPAEARRLRGRAAAAGQRDL
jgi:tetratricopeptide (TPR) repeat protein